MDIETIKRSSREKLIYMWREFRQQLLFVKYTSCRQCASVGEIVIVWNRGPPPNVTEFGVDVPVRIRQEDRNALTNRFMPDPLIRNRAVLSLDDGAYPCPLLS